MATKAELQNLVTDYAYGYGIDPAIALAQAQRESGFDPNAVGSSGERGLMQFMPGTWARFGQGDFNNAFDPDYNLTAWGNYLTWLLNRYNWDYSKALQGYNGGEGNVDKGTVSGAAKGYASWILANAGKNDLDPVMNGLADSLPFSGNTIFGLPIALALAIGGFGLWLALKD